MPRNKHERQGTSTFHYGTVDQLSTQELKAMIKHLVEAERSFKNKNGRKSIRKTREEYESELASRSSNESK